nr:hypothetical protein [Anoxybacillus flavithermus]
MEQTKSSFTDYDFSNDVCICGMGSIFSISEYVPTNVWAYFDTKKRFSGDSGSAWVGYANSIRDFNGSLWL